MAYYYIKSGGTATGDAGRYATQQTGTFAALGASGYYDNINAALGATTTPAAGDYINCSSAHSHNYAATTTLTFTAGVVTVSVDDSNCNQELVGAVEQATGAVFIDLTVVDGEFHSMQFDISDDFFINESTFYDCHFELSEYSAGPIQPIASSKWQRFIRCTIDLNASSTIMIQPNQVRNKFSFYGCTFTDTGGNCANFIDFANQSGTVEIIGGSIPACTSIVDFNSFSNCEVILRNLKLGAFTNYAIGKLSNANQVLKADACDTSNEELESYHYSHGGEGFTDTGIYRTASDGSTSFSRKITTDANASTLYPFRMLVGAVRLDASTTKTVTVQLVHDSQGSGTGADFTNGEVSFELIYQDDLTTEGFVVDSRPSDLFAPTDLTNSAETWTGTGGMTTPVKQEVALSTSGATGKEAVAEVWINVYVASVTLYVCPKLDIT